MKKLLVLIIVFILSIVFYENCFAMKLTSDHFKNGEYIPRENTGFGKDISPVLYWTDIPAGTKSLAIIMDDPDAPGGTWVHWVVYNIPVSLNGLKSNIEKITNPGDNVIQGINSFNSIGYGGPYPPAGPPHRYIFKLYALDTVLKDRPGLTKRQLKNAMSGHILDETSLTGLYKR